MPEPTRSPAPHEVRFASGDREGLVAAYDLLAPSVRRWVRRFFRSAFEQEEAVQEVWLTAHRMQRHYDVNRAALGPWLRALTANRCRELLRAAGRRPDAGVPLEDVEDALWLDSEAPDDAVFRAQVAAAVEKFKAELAPDEAKALQALVLEGHSHQELAQALEITVRQSKYLKLRLLERAAKDPGLAALVRDWRAR